MKQALKKQLSAIGLAEPAKRARRAAAILLNEQPRPENYVAVRRDLREIRVSAETACTSLPTIVENFDYIHAAVVPRPIDNIAIADFSEPRSHRFKRSGTEAELSFEKDYLAIRKGDREIRVHPSHLIYVWDLADVLFDHDHAAVVPEMRGEVAVADYSRPRVHRLARSGLEFAFPSVPESEESAEAYVTALRVQLGDAVLDLGAYAGVSAYFLSHAVGAEGVVGCFEPDEMTFQYLEENIARHELRNVKTFRKGVWSETTTLEFQAEGNMGSALVDVIRRRTNVRPVEVVSLADAAALLGGRRIAAVKMDVEGAEIEILKRAGEFLHREKPRLVIEPHPIAGKMNTDEICAILRSFNYSAELLSQGADEWPLVAAYPN